MKIRLIFLLILCLGLSGCTVGEAPRSESNAPATQAATTDDARLAYYESTVTALQKELLDLKAALYVSRAEYAELEETLRRLEESTSDTETYFCYVVEQGGATITQYVGTAREIEIPATLGGYPVRAIGERAFAGNTTLTAVVVPAGVERIGWFAFSGCVMLERISLPESVTLIDYGATEHCASTLTVTCQSGSYAWRWAESYGIRLQRSDV